VKVYGKIENMKILKKESKAHVRFASFESAEKVTKNNFCINKMRLLGLFE